MLVAAVPRSASKGEKEKAKGRAEITQNFSWDRLSGRW